MQINVLSHSNHKDQLGGGPLLLKGILHLFELLGIQTNVIYQQGISKKIPLLGYLKSLFYGFQQRSLFQFAKLNLNNTDLLQLEHLKFFNWSFSPGPRKIIYNAHNLEFELFFQKDSVSRKKNRLIQFEASKIKKADLCFFCSKRELELMSQYIEDLHSKAIVIPNLIDHRSYHISADKKFITFIGTLDYKPNIEAVSFLLDSFQKNIPPNLLSQYEFIIAGRNPSKEMIHQIKDSIFELRSNLSDSEMKDLHAKTKIHLVPLFNGSGTRLKIVEALFSGARVLSTPIGAEGIESKFISLSMPENFSSSFLNLLAEDSQPITKSSLQDEINSFDINGWANENLSVLKEKLAAL